MKILLQLGMLIIPAICATLWFVAKEDVRKRILRYAVPGVIFFVLTNASMYALSAARGVKGLNFENMTISYCLKWLLGSLIFAVIYMIIYERRNIYRNIWGVLWKEDKESFWETLLMPLALSFLSMVYAPLELFFSNFNEFWFEFGHIWWLVLINFALLYVVLVVALLFCYGLDIKVFRICEILYFIIFATGYVQGNFLSGNLPPMDGTDFAWEDYADGRVGSIMVWIAVIALVLIARKLVKYQLDHLVKYMNYLSMAVSAMLVITLVTLGITSGGFETKSYYVSTTENEFTYSEDENFIILVLDAMDAWTMSDIIDNNPEYKEVFSDFTYYDNVVCAYPFTRNSIPFILSGDWYENDEDFNEYVKNAVDNSPILNYAEQNQYNMGIYDADLNIKSSAKDRYNNLVAEQIEPKSNGKLASLLMQMGGIKFAPFDLKKYCYFDNSEVKALREIKTDVESFTWGDRKFYEDTKQSNIEKVNEKVFKFIHLEGAHVPYHYDKNLNEVEEGTYKQMQEAAITTVNEYLNKLKEANVYDNSVIIIMGDHGYDENDVYGRQNAVLFMKGINESHDMYTSSAPISYVDLQDAFAKLMDGELGDNVFEYKEGDYRERRYLFYRYTHEYHLTEYIQTGQARDLDTMIPTGNEYILED